MKGAKYQILSLFPQFWGTTSVFQGPSLTAISTMNQPHFLLFMVIFSISCTSSSKKQYTEDSLITTTWSAEKSNSWYDNQPWLVGSNFNPSSSINQLEFWMRDTWDSVTIDRELGWAEDVGMNIMRVYLHNLLWEHEREGFKSRLEEYLQISSRHGIKTMFVLLDDVWNPVPKYGKQPNPVPHRHNSGWVQAPGAAILGDTSRHNELESYIKGVLTLFKNDQRVLLWDIYNEPDNVSRNNSKEVDNKHDYSLALIKKVVEWTREVNPSQPITSGIWRGKIKNWGNPDSLPEVDRFMIENSDIISFHAYDAPDKVKQKIKELKKYGKPLICTEFLARGFENTFENILPILKSEKVSAINWGLVDGKTQTKYPWSSWVEDFQAEPDIWHHDIFRKDGSPYKKSEVDFIKSLISE